MTKSFSAAELIAELEAHANPANVAGMARYGISTEHALGVPIPLLRALARRAGKDHRLAGELWASGIHEARILATMVEDPARMTSAQMDRWARDFDSWDVCDQACQNLFRYTPFACAKAVQWSRASREFVRRAGFALMAAPGGAAQSRSDDAQFEAFLKLIASAATDDRNMVKKAVNWALRRHRQTQRAAARESDCRGRAHRPDGLARRPLDRQRRPARTAAQGGEGERYERRKVNLGEKN